MTWDTVNVLTIPWAGEIAGKLAGKILDVLEMYWVGTCWVHYPFPCDVLAMYRLGTPPLAPSVPPLPVTVPAAQHVVIHLHPQLAQYHLERFLDHQGPMFLLTLLEESTHLEAQPLTR